MVSKVRCQFCFTKANFKGVVIDHSIISAPSNIALIKYMGKVLTQSGNRPTNASLSYTLDHLMTFVRIEKSDQTEDTWAPLKGENYFPFEMSAKGKEKFLKHFQMLKSIWGVKDYFHIESANNFPADSGIASSASSYAALTKASAQVFQKINPQVWGDNPLELSKLSQKGSGSSCRSFFTPWAVWEDEGARSLDLPMSNLLHLVLVSDSKAKAVSSSEAHVRVTQSRLFPGRVDRAQQRYLQLIESLKSKNWKVAFEISWDEFIDMHELFSHCPEPFDYRTPRSNQILSELKELWAARLDGPIVTMDAGSSIHLLMREDQKDLANQLKKQYSLSTQVWSSF